MRNSALFEKWGLFKKGMDAKGIQLSFASHIEYSLSKDQYTATMRDLYQSLALTARDRIIERWIQTQQMYHEHDVKRIYYLSAEYLMGRVLTTNLINLGMYDETKKAMDELHVELANLVEMEPDMGLGNGGLGRLAACFLDSMATLELPAHGYGIRYEFGIFDQVIKNLRQTEHPENWLKYTNPWEIARPEYSYTVRYYGKVEEDNESNTSIRKNKWIDTSDVLGIAYDTPIAGYGNNTVNTLRLWAARASKEFNLEYFQHGDYLKAVEEKNISENISKVLYPNDEIFEGKELRLKQQYFFVSCSIQDIIRRYLIQHNNFDQFPEKVVIQMNDTHPSLAVAELMRILLDVHSLGWKKAWDITSRTCAYTNHTLLSEALEKWPVNMFKNLLPRHLQIIYEINRRFLREVSTICIGDENKIRRMSLIEEGNEQKIRMAHLAIVGSHSVNGVAELHTKLLRETVLKDFDEMFPGKFTNKTNGITPRRWLLAANPDLSRLISKNIGTDWITNLNRLRDLEPLSEDPQFRKKWQKVKQINKEIFTSLASGITGLLLDPDSIFDFQVKRIHEYKRQLLNILHVIYCWLKIKKGIDTNIHPRTFIFGGKAAPGYFIAKLIIRLICHTAKVLNNDKSTNSLLQVLFIPNYRVSLAERIFPAADVSEQISTAGYEASGTSNMKFALNGAMTIGTLDGANIEIMEEVGKENIFIFGLSAQEVVDMRHSYDPKTFYHNDPILKKTIDLIKDNFFSPEDHDLFMPLIDNLLNQDPYLVLADFESYHQAQNQVNELYQNQDEWTRKAILNVARIGKFSSDRTISEYNNDIWKVSPLKIIQEERLPR
ncbi:Glycogen phosphorylase [Desulfonema limicola]|uniref:Alpha-1,4 glucan phosphorylase n=1 Tax=Desulfonema limicola TaxID=45656 RepID=A0A975B9Y6_9BACT|nr:glycogen/starch/alpha-glucan phosphorylase [Desulfonema limicola]QTA81347.1 Glycogen phosphorylase [Desulfonema limicola]